MITFVPGGMFGGGGAIRSAPPSRYPQRAGEISGKNSRGKIGHSTPQLGQRNGCGGLDIPRVRMIRGEVALAKPSTNLYKFSVHQESVPDTLTNLPQSGKVVSHFGRCG